MLKHLKETTEFPVTGFNKIGLRNKTEDLNKLQQLRMVH